MSDSESLSELSSLSDVEPAIPAVEERSTGRRSQRVRVRVQKEKATQSKPKTQPQKALTPAPNARERRTRQAKIQEYLLQKDSENGSDDESDRDGGSEAPPAKEPNVEEVESVASSEGEDEDEEMDDTPEVLADDPAISFIVMFRSRFNDAFHPKLAHFGPQDIERGVVDSAPSPQVEALLCAILTLLLNRKKPIETEHYNRALEDAVSSHKHEWPMSWDGVNPIAGTKTFRTIGPTERLSLMKALIIWSLYSSEAVSDIIKSSYKQSRREDDKNQPLSVQPWGKDGDKNRYWLVEGRDDTPFRLYKESTSYTRKRKWRSVAGSISELREIADALENEQSQASKRLSTQINSALPRFEATEEKRKRREYRMSRKAIFSQMTPPTYEGPRTRGRRVYYNFGDEDDSGASTPTQLDFPLRRSTRTAAIASGNASVSYALRAAEAAEERREAAVAAAGPVTTGSGRLVRTRVTDEQGNTGWASSGAADTPVEYGRRRRRSQQESESEEDGGSEQGEPEEADEEEGEGREESWGSQSDARSDYEDGDGDANRKLVVTLRFSKPAGGLAGSKLGGGEQEGAEAAREQQPAVPGDGMDVDEPPALSPDESAAKEALGVDGAAAVVVPGQDVDMDSGAVTAAAETVAATPVSAGSEPVFGPSV